MSRKPKDELETALERAAVAPPPEEAQIAADDIGATALAETGQDEEAEGED